MRTRFLSHFSRHRMAQLAFDLLVSTAALTLAFALRFEGPIPDPFQAVLLTMLPAAIAIRFACRFTFGLHRQLWRYVSMRDAVDLALAITLGSLLILIISEFVLNVHVPRGIIAIDWVLNMLGYMAVRGLRRIQTSRQPGFMSNERRARVLLVGAGDAGNMIAKEIQSRNPELELVAFVDDDRLKLRSRAQGVEIVGTTHDIPRLVTKLAIDEIILCVPSASQAEVRRILTLCHETKARVKTLPALRDLIAGHLSINTLREVGIEDLLGRNPVEFDRESVSGYLAGRVVMVTGAGGSIGSELCRQLAELAPSQLILLGRGEFSIYTIEMEMRERFPTLNLVSLIADVRDMNRLDRIFSQYKPDVIFHAAAHKHVPLMERNPSEAIINNVLGTSAVANMADRHNAETFVLISTDKAVNPTNVMGASKRVAEMVVQDLATRSETRFMSVRFGNVLGSRGSVIPLFKAQIAKGGPITITHPDINRFFMTIPEATQLVLQAGAVGQGGEVFVLDMGDPVKIVDLARDLIRLSGLEPDVDIKIKFTGLRPGEKLYEELMTAEEGTSATTHKKIFIARPEAIDRERLQLGVIMLQSAATAGDDQAIRRGLLSLVETYKYQKPETGVLELRVKQAEQEAKSDLASQD